MYLPMVLESHDMLLTKMLHVVFKRSSLSSWVFWKTLEACFWAMKLLATNSLSSLLLESPYASFSRVAWQTGCDILGLGVLWHLWHEAQIPKEKCGSRRPCPSNLPFQSHDSWAGGHCSLPPSNQTLPWKVPRKLKFNGKTIYAGSAGMEPPAN